MIFASASAPFCNAFAGLCNGRNRGRATDVPTLAASIRVTEGPLVSLKNLAARCLNRSVVGMSVSSVKRCAGASRPCSPNLWSYRFRIHHLRVEPQPQIGLASLCGRTAAARTAAARSTTAAAAETASTETAAAETAAAETAAAETAAARTVHIRRDRRRWLPV